MSVPYTDASAILMGSPNRGVVRKWNNEELDNNNEEDVKYLKLLKAEIRRAFLDKFIPIIKADGEYSQSGGYPDNPCWLVTGYARQGRGRPRASYQVYTQGRRERITVSGARASVIFAMIQQLRASDGTGDIEWPYPEDFEASHLCHQANCIRPVHIVMESKADNLARSICPGVLFCPNCPIILYGCAHSPPCIRSNWAVTCNSCGHGVEDERKEDERKE